MRYVTPRWLLVYGYILLILVVTPYLPPLIQWSSSNWPGRSVDRFVLGVEVSMGILLIVLAGGVFFYNRGKFLRFMLITGGSIATACFFYRVVPNPYELTHLPEYAILSILMVRAIKVKEGTRSYSLGAGESCRSEAKVPKPTMASFPVCVQRTARHYSTVFRLQRTERRGTNLLYFRSAVLTTAFGATDELYQGLLPGRSFIWYDILLNGLGGVLGLVIVWGMSRK